ncbi:DUF6932 family protein [Tsukamurella ocularis]
MTLPFQSNGELGPGVHRVDDDELYEIFVESAPHTARRQQLHSALRLYLDVLRTVAGPGRVLIGGGFVSHKNAAPADVDLVYICRDAAHLEQVLTHPEVLPLLTLQAGYAMHPFAQAFQRLQPVGGKVDAFLTTPRSDAYWRTLWSTVKGTGNHGIPRAERGYLEVTI